MTQDKRWEYAGYTIILLGKAYAVFKQGKYVATYSSVANAKRAIKWGTIKS